MKKWDVDAMVQSGEIEIRQWDRQPYGGQRVGVSSAIIAVHRATGCAFMSDSERSQLRNKENAVEQLEALVRLIVQ